MTSILFSSTAEPVIVSFILTKRNILNWRVSMKKIECDVTEPDIAVLNSAARSTPKITGAGKYTIKVVATVKYFWDLFKPLAKPLPTASRQGFLDVQRFNLATMS